MNYYAPPPAIIRPAQQERIPYCESLAKKSQPWEAPERSFMARTSKDVFRFFMDAKDMTLEATVEDKGDSVFTNPMKKPVSLGFYKGASSQRKWDAVLIYFSNVQRPFSTYVSNGLMTENGLLSTHDWLIHFMGETEIVKGRNYDFKKLTKHLPEFTGYACDPGLRFHLDHLLWQSNR